MSNVKLDISWEIDEEKRLENMIIETAKAALELEGAKCDVDLSVVVTDNENIREINNEQRNIDRATDVLSFPMVLYDGPADFEYINEDLVELFNQDTGDLVLGDIVLSPQNLWLGNINYNDAFEIGIVSPSYKVFSIREDYNPYFVSCFLKTPKALYEYANASEQGASIVRRNLDINAFMAICFPMPDRIMQDKVSERLRAINMKFDIEKQILEKLNIEKQYLLRQMFI